MGGDPIIGSLRITGRSGSVLGIGHPRIPIFSDTETEIGLVGRGAGINRRSLSLR